MDPVREKVGRRRFEEFLAANGALSANQMSLTLSLGFAGMAGYSDEALEAIERDIADLADAGRHLCNVAERLRVEWRQQRIAEEQREQGS